MTARNPWLDIPLADYEAHMASPAVAEAGLLADALQRLVEAHAPRSLAILGCAGGNGLERLSPALTKRVVGVDLNPDYLLQAARRFSWRFRQLVLLAGDLADPAVDFEPVEMIYAGLVLEYTDWAPVVARVRGWLAPRGRFAALIQLPSCAPEAPPTPAKGTLRSLSQLRRQVSSAELRAQAANNSLALERSELLFSTPGRPFELQVFQGRLVPSRRAP